MASRCLTLAGLGLDAVKREGASRVSVEQTVVLTPGAAARPHAPASGGRRTWPCNAEVDGDKRMWLRGVAKRVRSMALASVSVLLSAPGQAGALAVRWRTGSSVFFGQEWPGEDGLRPCRGRPATGDVTMPEFDGGPQSA